ncbi:MAG TPA: RNA polymerase sigma factor [Chloroflexota bacterium]|nr:RNA polymerase sigma factor [Chloroflexota bacterium]
MAARASEHPPHLDDTQSVSASRDLLLRFCTRYTGDPVAAEDLAQQTLLEALEHRHELRNPESYRSWLFGIARNQCRLWARSRGREVLGLSDPDDFDPGLAGGYRWQASDIDLQLDLERDDLARLLDRAMALLPAETRAALVERYIRESPQAEIAKRLGLTEGAVEARLHRGKLALRRLLTTELSDEAVSYGLVQPKDAGWQTTRIWCPGCGKHKLEGWLRPREGKLDMRCPGCSSRRGHFIHSRLGTGLQDVRTYRPAVTRVLGVIDVMFRARAKDGAAPCPVCGAWLPIATGIPPWVPSPYADPNSIYLWHPGCGGADSETWHSLTWSLPEARNFWREHPRMRFLPEREIEVAGSPAVVTGFESMTGGARLEVVALRDSLRVLSVNGSPSPRSHHAGDTVE